MYFLKILILKTYFFSLFFLCRFQDITSLTVLVLGKGGVGKSSTVNSLIGERVAVVSAFQVLSDNLLSESWRFFSLFSVFINC